MALLRYETVSDIPENPPAFLTGKFIKLTVFVYALYAYTLRPTPFTRAPNAINRRPNTSLHPLIRSPYALHPTLHPIISTRLR